MPRLVLVSTSRRVALMDSRTVAPTPFAVASSIAGPIATALTTKSANVRFSKSAPRWTFPTLGAVASKRHASVAHWPVVRESGCIGFCLPQEFSHQGYDTVCSIFDYVMPAVFQPLDFRLGPVRQKPVEAFRPEAPVLHPPDQLNRPRAE